MRSLTESVLLPRISDLPNSECDRFSDSGDDFADSQMVNDSSQCPSFSQIDERLRQDLMPRFCYRSLTTFANLEDLMPHAAEVDAMSEDIS